MFFPRGILKNDISFISFASPKEEVGSLWIVLPSSCLLIGCWSQVAQSCPTLGDPVDCIAYQALQSMEFSRQEYWSGLPFPSPGDLPNPGIEPGSPALQADCSPSEPPGLYPVSLWKQSSQVHVTPAAQQDGAAGGERRCRNLVRGCSHLGSRRVSKSSWGNASESS